MTQARASRHEMEARERAAEVLARSTGVLSTAAMRRVETEMGWFRTLSAEDRSWVGLIVQAGIKAFVDWFRGSGGVDAAVTEPGTSNLASSVFGAAPRALAGVISLRQTVDLVRLSIDVVESNVDELLDPAESAQVRQAVLVYGREVAFATAAVYARAAEVRGAWDARLEALVVDAVLRAETDEAVLSRASAVGWAGRSDVVVVLGPAPAQRTETDLFEAVRRTAAKGDFDALCAVQGERLVVLLGGVTDARVAAEQIAELFDDGAVVVGPITEDLSKAHLSARAALAAYRAAPGWPQAPRPVLSHELLPERALAGDGHARRFLVEDVYLPLMAARGGLGETVARHLETGGSVEATARELFVHANTVRYRLRQCADRTGYSPSVPRDALILRMAMILGRQSGRSL